jgi:hypothetical protein
MKQVIFADSIFNISVTGNLVRIDLGVTELGASNVDGKQEVRLVKSEQLVMPLDGFVRAVGIQDQIIRRLINDGVVKVQSREGAPEVASDSATLN